MSKNSVPGRFKLVNDIKEINVGDVLNLTTPNIADFVCKVIACAANYYELKSKANRTSKIITKGGMEVAVSNSLVYKDHAFDLKNIADQNTSDFGMNPGYSFGKDSTITIEDAVEDKKTEHERMCEFFFKRHNN